MAEKSLILNDKGIKERIYSVRGLQVILDRDLAELYNVKPIRLREQVKRNIRRFPSGFMFKLTDKEVDFMVSQFAIPSRKHLGGSLPYAFTEQGVAMLSGVLKSDVAVKVSIQIMNAFVSMRRFIANNADVFHRLNTVELKLIMHDKKFSKIFKAIEDKGIMPKKGIFFDGQIFDAYRFVSDIVRSAKKSIVLIDNYVDDSVLTLFSKRNKNVRVKIYAKNITKQLSLDLAKHNSQYPKIEIKQFSHSHDRFMIIDNEIVYHFGASLKDLGKKWFAFSRLDKESINIMDRLG